MEQAKERRDKCMEGLKMRLPGWQLCCSVHSDRYELAVSEKLFLYFWKSGESTMNWSGKSIVCDYDDFGSIVARLKFDPAFQMFLMNENLKLSMEKTEKMYELLRNMVEFVPESEAVKELEADFEKMAKK